MSKLLKDPFAHFLALGAVLFAVLYWRSGGVEDVQTIRIDAERVARLSTSAALVGGQTPTREQLEALVEPAIREEIMYREALALGLDENDDEVRRRLVEKMEYLTQDLADPEPASESELEAFYDANPQLFRIPETVSFEQVYFSPRERGEQVGADAEAALGALRGGRDSEGLGDRTPLSLAFENAPRQQVSVLFGESMTEALFTMDAGNWTGPFESDFGLHLVRLRSKASSRMPAYDEIATQVAESFGEDSRRRENEAAYSAMRERYDIVVEWPEAEPAP